MNGSDLQRASLIAFSHTQARCAIALATGVATENVARRVATTTSVAAALRRGSTEDAKEIARLCATATRGLRLAKPAAGTTLLDQALLVAWSVFDDFVFTAEDDSDAEAELAAQLNQPLPSYALAEAIRLFLDSSRRPSA